MCKLIKNNHLEIESRSMFNKLNNIKRVAYSTVGLPGIEAGCADYGDLIEVSISEDRTTCYARVLFDGKSEPEWMDARLLTIA